MTDDQPDPRRVPQIVEGPGPLPEDERVERDRLFKRSTAFSIREGLLWDEAWSAARSYYLSRIGGEEDTR